MVASGGMPRPLTLGESFFASGVATVGATLLTHPIDAVKVRLQLANKGNARAESFSISYFVRKFHLLYRSEGHGVFVSGIRSAAVRAGTYGTARIGLCEPLKDLSGTATGAALVAGVLATVVGNPFEVLKVRLQARPAEAAGGEARAMLTLVREEGVAALGRGFNWAAARSALLTASQVVPYSYAKQAFRPVLGTDGVLLHVAASLAAGIVTCTVTSPVDVMKTRVMSAARGQPQVSLTTLLRNEGPLFFFKGWTANYVRIGPQTLFIFLFFEQVRRLITELRPGAAA